VRDPVSVQAAVVEMRNYKATAWSVWLLIIFVALLAVGGLFALVSGEWVLAGLVVLVCAPLIWLMRWRKRREAQVGAWLARELQGQQASKRADE
jgi:uncharacterized membrane protein